MLLDTVSYDALKGFEPITEIGGQMTAMTEPMSLAYPQVKKWQTTLDRHHQQHPRARGR